MDQGVKLDEPKPTGRVPNMGEGMVVKDQVINLTDPPCNLEGIRINMGCGSDYRPKFLNVDPVDKHADADWDAGKIPLKDCSVAQIVAIEVLEHIPMPRTLEVLLEWNRVLKPGGQVIITVPDIQDLAEKIARDPENEWNYAILYGNQSHEGQFHKAAFTPKRLFCLFGMAGFRTVNTAYFEYGGHQQIYCEAGK